MITVIGLDGSPLAPRAASALAGATLVVGGRRHLATAATGGARTVVLGELPPALDALAGHTGDAVVLASGDPGFFGIVRALRERGLACTVLPAVSSVAAAFARASLPWDDAMVVSAHGRGLRQAVNVCRAYPKVAVLTGPGAGPPEVGAALAGWRRRLIVCEHLGGDAERVTECSPAGAGRQAWEDPNVVLVLADPGHPTSPTSPGSDQPGADPAQHSDVIKEKVSIGHHFLLDHEAEPSNASPTSDVGPGSHDRGHAGPSFLSTGTGWVWPRPPAGAAASFAGGWALAEDCFEHRDAVITKAEVRALALARLAPGPGMLIWDVGAGTGSVAVECARFGAAVIAVERDGQRRELVRANARRYGVDVRVVGGAAPAALAGLPDPDAVFVGGGGPSVVEAAAARCPARIVVALAAVERAGQAHASLTAAGYAVEGTLIQAARFAPLPGGVHRLASTNPVFLLCAAQPGGTEFLAAQPGGTEPAAAHPSATEPAAAQPGTAQPCATEPAAIEPAAVEPAAVELRATPPGATRATAPAEGQVRGDSR